MKDLEDTSYLNALRNWYVAEKDGDLRIVIDKTKNVLRVVKETEDSLELEVVAK